MSLNEPGGLNGHQAQEKPNRFISVKSKRSKKKAKIEAKGCVSCHENMAHRSFPVKEEAVLAPGV
ncbi:MAG: hypothetical protein LBC94_10415 [Desulfovibrio sp.]|nr:hypothetical protein [Desulfovibrio sp.]